MRIPASARHGQTPADSEHLDLSGEVVIVHTEPGVMMRLSAALAAMRYRVTAIHAVRAIDSARSLARDRPLAMIVSLDGTESAAEIDSLVAAAPGTRFLLLAPDMRSHAPVARILNALHVAGVQHDESPLVTIATLVALLARAAERVE